MPSLFRSCAKIGLHQRGYITIISGNWKDLHGFKQILRHDTEFFYNSKN